MPARVRRVPSAAGKLLARTLCGEGGPAAVEVLGAGVCLPALLAPEHLHSGSSVRAVC